MDFSAFCKKISDNNDELNDRFTDFGLLKAKGKLSNNPIEVNIELNHLTFSKNYVICNWILFFCQKKMSVTTRFVKKQ